MINGHNAQSGSTARGYATPVDTQLQKEYAFEVGERQHSPQKEVYSEIASVDSSLPPT
jgi:hypothetical protein